MKNSTTILLPEWFKILPTYNLHPHIMPCDVSTHWNSTFYMLTFSTQYCQAIDSMTAACASDLCKYELGPDGWKIAEELCDVLVRATVACLKGQV
jgi:hypothetical protein